MALYTSANGWFEITALSFFPQVIAPGESTTITVTIKNTSGVNITKTRVNCGFYYMAADGYDYDSQPSTLLYGENTSGFDIGTKAISWNRNTEQTFSGTMTFNPGDHPADMSSRLIIPGTNEGLFITAWRNESGSDQFSDVSDSYGGRLKLVTSHWQPRASMLMQRCLPNGTPDDQGERLLLTANVSHGSDADVSQMYCRLYYEQGAAPDGSSSFVNLTSQIPDLISGVTGDYSLVTQSFSNGVDWYFLFVFGDDYEQDTVSGSIARAFANLHLSGASTGGAAFGRFSSSTEGNPKLESEYPFYAYGGIEGVNNYSTAEVLTGGHWIDGKPIYRFVATGTVTLAASTTLLTLPSVPDNVIDIRMAVYAGSDWKPVCYTYYNNNNWDTNVRITNNGDVIVQAGSSAQVSTKYNLIIEYTKQ
jgi:hypothetical protein